MRTCACAYACVCVCVCLCVCVSLLGQVRSVSDHLVLPAAPRKHVTVGKRGVERHCGFGYLVPFVTAFVDKKGYQGM